MLERLTMTPQLIVMLTHNDFTVMNAAEIFESCKDSGAQYWGFKEHPLPKEDMKRLFSRMKECGKTTFLEVVAYTEAEGLEGAHTAVECGCDVLMGTVYHDSIHAYCQRHGMRYMPFIGRITGRPSILEGSIEDMISEAEALKAKGVFGIDLLGYRYTADAERLISTIVSGTDLQVCVAGSIDSNERLQFVRKANPWAFTIGSAFFEHKFGGTIAEQIRTVCHCGV